MSLKFQPGKSETQKIELARDRKRFNSETQKIGSDRQIGNRFIGRSEKASKTSRKDGGHPHSHRSRLSHLPFLQTRSANVPGENVIRIDS